MTNWALAVLPIALLLALVLRGRSSVGTTALITAVVAVAIGAITFAAGPAVLSVGIGKGIWTGIWILYVVWPALLLYAIAARAGLDRMGSVFADVLPNEVENVLLVAWVLPSFIQGVAGFGTPIAVAAPLLLAMRIPPVLAVALPLVGYHWSVTFGSMGSSFYMGALTAGLEGSSQNLYAQESALILGVNMLVAGVLVCLMHGGLKSVRAGARMLLVTGTSMFVALTLAVRAEPSIGSLTAGAAGLLAVLALRAWTKRSAPEVAGGPATPVDDKGSSVVSRGIRNSTADAPLQSEQTAIIEPPPRRPLVVMLPYAYLLVLVLVVFIPPPVRAFVKGNLLVGPSFPATSTGLGITNQPAPLFTPIQLLGHPGTYILLAAVAGLATYRWAGIWPKGVLRETLATWARQAARSSLSIIALAIVATVMVDTGMVRTIASGTADVTGSLFPVFSPLIGAVGSFTTGSTTTSNALFSALQGEVATLIDVAPAHLVAAQTSGGNIGNSLAPVVMLIGVTAIAAEDRMSEVLRRVLAPAGVLMTVAIVMTLELVSLR